MSSTQGNPAPPEATDQGTLFDGDFAPLPEDVGFRGPIAAKAADITYRQLDYWARIGLVTPEVRAASGSGSLRLYSFRDILLLKVIKRLLSAGVTLQQIRRAVDYLHDRGVHDLTEVTLVSDGVSVYECTRDAEVIDILKGGQGMFAIAIGSVWRDMEGSLTTLPAEHRNATEETVIPGDELAVRRRRRAG